MNKESPITFQVFVFTEFMEQVLQLAQVSFEKVRREQLQQLLAKIIGDGDSVFENIEALAQIPDSDELTIFFSDLLERLDYEDPLETLEALDNVQSDFFALVELLFEEEEYVRAITTYIKGVPVEEELEVSPEPVVSTIAEGESSKEVEVPVDLEPEVPVADAVPEEIAELESVFEEETAPIEEELQKTVADISYDENVDYSLFEFIFNDLNHHMQQKQSADISSGTMSSLLKYLAYIGENYRRNPKLLLNQPNEEALAFASVLIDKLKTIDNDFVENYFTFRQQLAEQLKRYAIDHSDELIASYADDHIDHDAEIKAPSVDLSEKKVLQKKIYSYFDNEANFHIGELEKNAQEKKFKEFWVEMESLRTLVMIHGYEAFETACLRFQREKEQREPEQMDQLVVANAVKIIVILKEILSHELSGDSEQSKKVLEDLNEILSSEFVTGREEPELETAAFDEDLRNELEKIWFDRLGERDIKHLPNWLGIDLDNALILDYPEDFCDSLRGVVTFLEHSDFNQDDWNDFFKDWPRILQLKNTELLNDLSTKVIEYGEGAAYSMDDQNMIVPEIFKQIRKKFSSLAPYYQLTDDEQANFQQFVVELGKFISSSEYHDYLDKMITTLNENFFEESSDKIVKKYLQRISADYDDLIFPQSDLDVEQYKEKEPEKTEEWIDEVDKAVKTEADDEFLNIFQSESKEYMSAIHGKMNSLEDGDLSVIQSLENDFHNIASSASLVGLTNTANFTTELETILEEAHGKSGEDLENVPIATIRDAISVVAGVVDDPTKDSDLDYKSVLTDLNTWLDQLRASRFGEQDLSVEETLSETDTDPELLEVFDAEASQNIKTVYTALETLKSNPGDVSQINNISSATHNITSAAKMLGFSNIGDLTDKIETFSEEKIATETAFEAHQIEYFAEAVKAIESVMHGQKTEKSLAAFVNNFQSRMTQAGVTSDKSFEEYYNEVFLDDVMSMINNSKEEILIRQFVSEIAHNLTNMEEAVKIEQLINAPLNEWQEIVNDLKPEPVVRREAVTRSANIPLDKSDMLLDSSAAMVDSQLEMQEQLKRNKEILTELNSTQNLLNYIKTELDEIAIMGDKTPDTKKRQDELTGTLDKAVAKMNHLVSEMGRINNTFESRISSFDNLTYTFQRSVLQARQIKTSTLFKDIKPFINELESVSGKNFDVKFSGGSVELDKSTLDFLHEPLKELIANAVFHGIETPEERTEQKKSKKAKIKVQLSKKRNLVQLEVHDEGRGINLANIRDVAISTNHPVPDNEEELINLIFTDGFSMVTENNEYVGDGAGLSNLKKSIETIRGDISIDSEVNVYTRIVLVFPQHLKITDAAIVSNDEDFIALPLDSEDKIVTILKSEIVVEGEDIWVAKDDKYHPAVMLNTILNNVREGLSGNKFSAIQFNLGELDLYIMVDRLIGVETIVIRPLQKEVKSLSFLAGVAQLPDFRTVLVLETDILLKDLESKLKFEYIQKSSPLSEPRIDAPTYEHAVVFDVNEISREFLAEILRERNIETEVVSDLALWNEDMDKADLLFIDNESFHQLKTMKGLWIDAPRKIVLIHEGKLKEVPVGADALLAKPFDRDEVNNLL